MSLGSLQGALARIFTDPALRSAYFADPIATASQLGLRGPDAAALLALDATAVRDFADMLRRKRIACVRKALPLTCRMLGADFACRVHAACIFCCDAFATRSVSWQRLFPFS